MYSKFSTDTSSTSSKLSTSAIVKYVDKLKLEYHRNTTRKNYYLIWRNFNEFFIRLDVKPESWEERLVLYIGFLVEKDRRSTTIRSYISAIKSVLEEDGVILSENKYVITSLTKACKLRNDKVQMRLPIHKRLMHMIIDRCFDKFDNQPYLLNLYKAIFCVAYYGMFRIGELTSGDHPVKAFDVHIGENKNKMVFVLRTSKTHWKNN